MHKSIIKEKNMIKTVNEHMFRDEFQVYERDNFSYEGLGVLFNYLEEFEEATDSSIELDVVALCCEFTEYAHIGEFWLDYGQEDYPDIEAIENATTVIPIKERLDRNTLKYVDSESFIISAF